MFYLKLVVSSRQREGFFPRKAMQVEITLSKIVKQYASMLL